MKSLLIIFCIGLLTVGCALLKTKEKVKTQTNAIINSTGVNNNVNLIDTISLNDLNSDKKGTKAYNQDRSGEVLITGWDYTYLTDTYSPDKPCFYYNGRLFSGVAKIENKDQYTFISFNNGYLNGLWHDVMHWNSGLMNKGYYVNGKKNGIWIEGGEISDVIIIDRERNYLNGKLEGISKCYFNSWYLNLRMKNFNIYEMINYKNNQPVGTPIYKYFNDSLVSGIIKSEIIDGIHNKYVFVQGVLQEETRIDNEIAVEVKKYAIKNNEFVSFDREYHENGKVSSEGSRSVYKYGKLGQWLYYNNGGNLVKKEFYDEIKASGNFLDDNPYRAIWYDDKGNITKDITTRKN